MSCCKVDVSKFKKQEKPSLVKNIIKNIWSIVASIGLLTIGFPFLYLICLYFILTSYVTETDNSVGKLAKTLVNALKMTISKSERDKYLSEDEDDFIDLIKNPENYEIIGLEENEEHKN